jgi:hypothetical protein
MATRGELRVLWRVSRVLGVKVEGKLVMTAFQPLLRPSLSFWIAEEAVRATVQASSMLPHPFWLEGFPITWAAEKTREALGRTDITKE